MDRFAVFDLDDTLIDTKTRHYRVYCDAVSAHGSTPLSFAAYRSMRAQGKTNRQIVLDTDGAPVDTCHAFWLQNIENERYLHYDHSIIHDRLLADLKFKNNLKLVLLSLRSNLVSAHKQLSWLSFGSLFDEVHFLKHQRDRNPKVEQLDLLKSRGDIFFFAGDSYSDQEAAEAAEVLFLGVNTGWRPLTAPLVYEDINDLLHKNLSHV